MSSIFGWSYPPGCNSVPGDDPVICDICEMVDDCCCPECPICGEQGNKKCYSNNHLTKEQREQLDRYVEIINEIYALEQRGKMCSTQNDAHYIDVELEKLYDEQDKLDINSFGHGLVITQEQIKSFNEEEDAMDEHWRQRDCDLAEGEDLANELGQALEDADTQLRMLWKDREKLVSEILAKQEKQYQDNRRFQRQMDEVEYHDEDRR